jgi:hypothetical protein
METSIALRMKEQKRIEVPQRLFRGADNGRGGRGARGLSDSMCTVRRIEALLAGK